MDRCVKIEHARILGGLNWAGVNTGVIRRARRPTRAARSRVARCPTDKFGFDTLCLHAGQIPDAATGARALPIYQTTSFVFDSADHAASLFNLQTFGNVYSRISNPTVAALEERVAALEGGRAALATATGMAAQTVALLTLCRAGDHIVASRTLYGGTYSQLAVTFAQFGIDATFVDSDDPANFRAGDPARTRRRCTSRRIGNPQLNVADLAAIAEIAHEAGVPLVVDNTLASPYLCRPFEHGADIVRPLGHQVPGRPRHHDGRHRRRVRQVPVGQRQVPADDRAVARLSRRRLLRDVRRLRLHDEGAHGDDAHARARRSRRMSAFLLLQGIETLHLRMPRHCESALARRASTSPRIPPSSGSTTRRSRAIRYRRARAALPAARRRRHPDVRRARRRRAPACASSSPCSSCRISPTSATRRRW